MTLVALFCISLVLLSSIKTTTLTQAHCLPDQRDSLIQLKQGFSNTNELHSWNASTNCCIWDGVTCDEQTGMVTALNLTDQSISGEINSALFNLSSLQYLNLSFNYFDNTPLPQTGFERLANLTHLDLSASGFAGHVPIGISALTNLISLELSTNSRNFRYFFISTNPLYLHETGLRTLLGNLTNLQVLRLDGVDISLNGPDWGNAIFQVGPTLQELSMADCELKGNLPDEIFHLTNLTELVLSDNSMLLSELPDSIGNLKYLSILYLHDCSFYGEVPLSITNLTRLEDLDLGQNRFTGTVPMSLFSHPSLESLDLSKNQLSGCLPEFSNGSTILETIYLDSNNLQGQVPISIFKSLQPIVLDLSSNNFNGIFNLDVIKHNKNLDSLDLSNMKMSITEGKHHNESFYVAFPQITYLRLASSNLTKIPSFLSYQTNINNLDLSNNKINGVIPKWLCSKTSISWLNLSHNLFTKIEEDKQFTSLDILNTLDIHSNQILGPVPLLPQIIVFVDFSSNYFYLLPSYYVYSLSILFLSDNILTGEIPLSICNATILGVLDLSYNNLTGTIPPYLLRYTEFREVLNLKSNQLNGPLLWNIGQGCRLRTIDLTGNRINGSLPQSLINCNNLEVLAIGNNQIVDRFPFWLRNLKNLRVLILRSNQLYGTISNIEEETKTNNYFFPKLKVFDISSNHFRGIIPKTFFVNLKAMVTNSDSSTFEFALSDYFAYYYHNSITVIWKEQVMEIKNSLSMFSYLDLSQNEFLGEIPEEIGQLKSLYVLNLSHNALTGPIPSEFCNLEQLESLDLSSNQLSGPIPQELTSLTFLASLNLSYNNLAGEVPQARQFSTFLNASYLGNPGLCGSPLLMKCAATPPNHGFNKDWPSKFSTDTIGLSVSIGLGLGVGFASVIWATISWENGRKGFNFFIDRFYFLTFSLMEISKSFVLINGCESLRIFLSVCVCVCL